MRPFSIPQPHYVSEGGPGVCYISVHPTNGMTANTWVSKCACTYINACNCTQHTRVMCTPEDHMNTGRESALKVDSGRKIPCCTGELNLHQHYARPDVYPAELHPCADSCFKSWQQSQTITRIKKIKMATFFEDLSRKFGAVRQ